MTKKFFDLLDETLNDPSDEATERLKIFYTCLGLGFSGWYAGQSEYLRGKMLDISHLDLRLSRWIPINPQESAQKLTSALIRGI